MSQTFGLSLDTYTLRARLTPALLVVLPIGIEIIALYPFELTGWNLLLGVFVTCGGTSLLSQLARDRGKKKEPALWKEWGGAPTTQMLSHTKTKYDPYTLARYHKKLNLLLPDIRTPSPEDEKENPKGAEKIYEACTSYLRNRTRDRKEFPLIFAENSNYGFRRNLWGMKPIAIIILIITSFVSLFVGLWIWKKDGSLDTLLIASVIIYVCLLSIWTLIIKNSWVRLAADAYAERLIESCDQLN